MARSSEADADKTVVCVHGLSANHTCWASVAGVLSPEYRVIAYDLRGRGDSDKPDTGYSLEAHGDDPHACSTITASTTCSPTPAAASSGPRRRHRSP